jgi:hypothetical protein
MKITEKTVITRNSELKPVDISGRLGMLNAETGKYIVLNEIGARIWDFAAEPVSAEDIITKLIQEFDVSPDDCRAQVLPYLENLKNERLFIILKP